MRIITSGCVTPMGNDEETIWLNLKNNEKPELNKKLEYHSVLPKRARRNSRFSDLCAYAVITGYKKIESICNTLSKERIGSLFTTGFGPLEINLDFAKQVIQSDPDVCSPILFANTVHNACLAGISMELKITGPSTMLLGSNHLLLTDMLLQEEKADLIFAGCVDEYNEELEESLVKNGFYSKKFSEGVVALGLTQRDTLANECVQISKVISFHLGENLYELAELSADMQAMLDTKLRQFFDEYKVDAVIINEEESVLGNCEKDIIQGYYPNIKCIDKFYDYFGNCLGCDLGMKTLVGKICMEKGEIPLALISEEYNEFTPKRIAILSTELTGNYSIVLLEK